MKKLIYIFFLLGFTNLQAQESNIDFFKDKTFNFDHFFVSGVKHIPTYESVDGPADDFISSIRFYQDDSINDDQLFLDIDIDCNFNFTADIKDTYYEMTKYHSLGSLDFCVSVTNLPNYQGIITGNHDRLSMMDPSSEKVYYTIDEDRQGFQLYTESDPTTVLVFTLQENMSASSLNAEVVLSIFYDAVHKEVIVKTPNRVNKITIYSSLGKEITHKERSKIIDVAALTSAIYFVKIDTDKGSYRKQLVIN